MCLRYYYLHTSERSYSRGYGTGSVLGRPHWLLLSYIRCPGSAVGEDGVAFWAWGAAGLQSLRGLFVPRMRWGGRGWTDAPGLGEGYRLEMSLESLQGGRGKARRGQVGYSTYVQVMVVLLDTTQSHKEWWSGAQLRPLILCLSVTSHSCSEEPGPHHLHFQLFSPLQITCTVVSELLATALWNGEGDGTPLQYSCLENPMDRGAGWAAVHGVARSRTRLSDFTFTFCFRALEKEMGTHSSVLAWRVPGTAESGGLLSLGSHRVGHD